MKAGNQRKTAPRKARARKQPQYAALVALQVKILARESFDGADLVLMYQILCDLDADIDARDRFWKTVNNRPGGKDAERKEYAAMDIAIDLASKSALLVDARANAARRWRLTAGQTDHAWREYGKWSREFVSKSADPNHYRSRQKMKLSTLSKKESQSGK
jgi:hypothetical protein